MSWFNKMFSLFLGDDEDNEKQKKHIDEFEADSSSEDEEMPQITDAKVVYEYPKGKFRFPVIPDQNTRPREKDDSREQRTRRPASRYSASQPKPGNSYHYEEKAAAKKPFRPSVIPSPVYGFHEQKRAKPENHTYRAKKQTEARVTLFNEEIEKEQKSAEHKQPVREEASVQTEKNGRPLIKSESRNPALRAEFEDVPQASTEIPKETEIRPERMTEGAGLAEEKALRHESERTEAPVSVHIPEETEVRPERMTEGAGLAEEKALRNEAVEETASASQNITEEDAIPAEQTPEQIEKLLDKIEETGEEMVLAEDAEAATEEQGKTYGSGKTHPDPEASVPEEPHTHGRASEITVQSDESSHRTDSNTPADALEETSGSRQTGWRQEQASCSPETAAPSAGEPESRQENRETTRINEDRPEAPRKREAGAAPGSKKGSVPFNVMMFASDKQKEKAPQGYQFPNMSLLDVPPAQKQDDQDWIHEQRELLDVTLENFNVKANVVHVTQGPSVTRFEVHPEPGVKVNKITNLSDDIKLSLSAKDIRIEAPIPGKNTIGIEVPNLHSKMVYLREMIRSSEFRTNPSPLTAALGLDISGKPVVADLKKMPHGLIAGATGSGKSVCINTILVSLLFKASPRDVKLLLIDPKMVELAPYNNIPHLVSPVITDAKAATAALKWVVEEMERRYELFAHSGVREIERFNEKVREQNMGEKLPYLVVVIDELADLMMVAPNEVEESICRIAQKARACGIHLLIATQRPSVDVITGLIKANIPTRIAFSVSSAVDSRTIIDMAGAEKLLGKGDMLFLENGSGKPVRLQGNFVSDREIDRVVSHVRRQQEPNYLFEQEQLVRQNPAGFDHDELFLEACEFAVEQNSASTSSLQRRFRIGYNRAARLIDMMEREGMISEAKGSKPREVLITKADLEQLIESSSLFG
ncbi:MULTISPECIES: DNA translocase FtsK [Bacillus]|jgi:S-DNA-T family DNA segregation ATPase FtsK/SpoIIIE|uniref:YtpT n=1 Tax=Bacillus licheniformis (strain ATCC 14580 / DSM 13 / JCM 2505 / CCUG 7422 / NBRC 12200 / NCIMB 9375 / NCTC 10341 / NRRL NRS-1264 / Gibson 46) TaxID=279010 RepID=Q65G21_BACLD|nr:MULTISPECIES: DNA translocase FtsK [Bacillus]AAU24634.1 YtpT [Bacillus licheniformis DSM 13 = ATCC 14580]AAU41993.1 DNA translocase SftA [Bacillus licheniformis DSM 13 = ATCC 14580]ARC59993.1 DNA translocase SftA [Bacillus licheniformis]AUZ31801.1 DNA translocase FtsK [Bacillus licheniformis]KUL07296.1 cell division protein FtsK [Bacillus licheniformis LMG 17339]